MLIDNLLGKKSCCPGACGTQSADGREYGNDRRQMRTNRALFRERSVRPCLRAQGTARRAAAILPHLRKSGELDLVARICRRFRQYHRRRLKIGPTSANQGHRISPNRATERPIQRSSGRRRYVAGHASEWMRGKPCDHLSKRKNAERKQRPAFS